MQELNPSLQERKIDVLFNQSRGALATSALAAVIIALLYRDYAVPAILFGWLGAYLALTGYRYYRIHTFLARRAALADGRRPLRTFLAGTAVSGCLWGAGAVYFIHVTPLHFATVMILVAGYLVMGAAFTYAVFPSVFLVFTLPLISPIIVYLLFRQDPVLQIYGILLLIFYAYSIFSALRYRRMATDFVTYQFDNQSLLQNLQTKQAEATRLNRELEHELESLRRAEEQLVQEKDKAEELADKLLTLSSQDGLTGIANRRHFDDFLANEWNRAIRAQSPLSLILCDIDHFKAYNDHYGHQQGDRCLIRVADILQQYARRGGDLAARYGGEEFAVILPETSLESATEIAERIRQSMLDIAIPHRASETGNIVTVSFGVATIMPRREQQSRLLVALADKALYEAKQQGRNRIAVSGPQLLDKSTAEHRA